MNLRAAQLLTLALAYVFTGKLGLTLDPVGGFATLVWPPTGIALFALVRGGLWLWPGVAVGAFVVNLWSGASWAVATLIAFGNSLEAVVGALLVGRVFRSDGSTTRVADAYALLAAALLSPVIGASMGALALTLGDVVPHESLFQLWRAWWLGDVLGDLVIAPVLFNWRTDDEPLGRGRRWLELVALSVAILASAVVSFSGHAAAPLSRPHMVFPALVWAAVRFGPRIAALSVLSISVLGIGFSMHGVGPFAEPRLADSLIKLQGFLGTAAVTSLFLAAVNAARSAAEHRLRQAVHARDEFLSVASHELRTPIAALSLQVTGLQRALRDSHSATNDRTADLARVERAVRQLGRLTRLVEELLDVSRISAGRLHLQLEDMDLAQLVREVVNGLKEQATRSGCTIDVDAVPVLGSWDRMRMEQVITNVLTNAIKYGAKHPIRVTVEGDAVVARLRVCDEGIGIAPGDMERVFDRFERVTTEHQHLSLGVGLYIARQVVEAHGGKISVESRLGHGSTFNVEVPRQHGEGRQPRQHDDEPIEVRAAGGDADLSSAG